MKHYYFNFLQLNTGLRKQKRIFKKYIIEYVHVRQKETSQPPDCRLIKMFCFILI